MLLSPGEKLGRYEILVPIGAGGMGEVYKARDPRLDRNVALKVSKSEFSPRFEREARTVAAFNHPNICQLYDIGPNYLVMELIDGVPLKGPLPVEKAVQYAGQILDALDAAHRKNIVHHDLKPANILVAKQGIKLLDFGLAKQAAVQKHDDVTMTALTLDGQITGTLQYMAPEQLQGKDADARSDIFSFGCVLYEMLSGERTFSGSTAASVIAAILEREPEPLKSTPPLDRVVRTCLAKDPDERFQSARDLKRDLLWAMESTAIVERASASRPKWPWIASAALCVVTVALALRIMPQTPAPAVMPRQILTIVPPTGTNLLAVGNRFAPEISPDSSSVLEMRLLRRLGSLDMVRLLGTEGITNAGFWSSDSKSIAFPETGVLKRMRIPDGAPEIISKLPGFLFGGSWGADGTILISCGNALYTVPARGGEVTQVEVPGLKQSDVMWPQFLPSSEDFLFLSIMPGSDEGEVYVATLRDGKAVNPVALFRNATAARFTPAGGGRLLFVSRDSLYSQKLDRLKRKLQGDPDLVVQGVASAPSQGVAHFSVSRSGVLAWRPGGVAVSQLTTFDRLGKEIGMTGPLDASESVSLSPDESHVLVNSWLMETNKPGRLNVGPCISCFWSNDGRHLLGSFSDEASLSERSVNASDAPRKVANIRGYVAVDVSPDGGTALLSTRNPGLYSVRLDGPMQERFPKLILQTDELISNARFSPDGRWIVYSARTSGNQPLGIFVQRFPGPGLRKQICRSGRYPVWRKDGKEIVYYYQSQIWSIRVESSGADLRFSAPEALFPVRPAAGLVLGGTPLAVTHDGSRIYFPEAIKQPNENVIHIMSGWLKP